MNIRVHVQVEVLSISSAEETIHAPTSDAFGATCAVKVSSGEASFTLLEVSAVATDEESLIDAIKESVEKRVRYAERRALGQLGQDALRKRFPKTFSFELDMNEQAFKQIVEEQRKHSV